MSIKLYINPEYKTLRPFFQMYHDLYEGDQAVLKQSKYLWLHELEKKPQGRVIREVREQRSQYVNHIETLISQWTSLIFRSDPLIPNSVAELMGDSLEDIDGAGTSFISFIRNHLVRNSLQFGRPVLYVGAYGTRPENLKQEMSRSDFRPYWEAIHPLSFVDYQVEKADPSRLNHLNFARTEFIEAVPRTSAQDEPFIATVSKEYIQTPEGLLIRRYKIAGQKEQDKFKAIFQKSQNQYLDDKAWELESEALLTDWDEIPIVAELNGESWLKDIAPHALKYYNTESVMDNIILFQAHQRIFFATNEMNNENIKMAAEYTNSIVPADTNIITVDPVSTDGIQRRLDNILNTIYRLGLNQVRMMSADSRAVQSDVTIREERASVLALVKSEMETIENIVNHGVRLYAKYLGREGTELEKVTFSTDIGQEDIDGFIKLYTAIRDDMRSLPKTKKASIKKLVQMLDLPDQDDLLEELEQVDFNAPVSEQTDPLAQFRRAINDTERA